MTQQSAKRWLSLHSFSRETMLLAGLGLAMAAVYLAVTLRLPWWRYSSHLYAWSGLLGAGEGPLVVALVAVGFLMLLYLAGWYLVRRCASRRLIWTGAVLFALILVWLLPITSDLFTYLSQAYLLTDLGLNPLLTAPLDAPADPLIQAFPALYSTKPSIYGPAWLLLSSPGTLGRYDIAGGLLYLKGLALAAFLGSAWLLEHILRQIRPNASVEALYLFAWNPFVLLMMVGEGHNDALMMALVLLSFWFLLKDRWVAATAVLALSVWVKFVSAIFFPLFLVHALRRQAGHVEVPAGRGTPQRGGLSTFARALLAAALVSAVVLAPFALLETGGAGPVLSRLDRFLRPDNWHSGPNALASWGLALGLTLFALALAGLVWWLWRAGGGLQRTANAAFVASLLLFLLGAARSQPWYLLWPATLAGLSDQRWAWPLIMVLSALMLAAQLWVEWGAPGW